MNKNFVVEVRPGGPARHAHGADDLASSNFLPDHRKSRAQVAVLGHNSVPVIDQDFVSVTTVRAGVEQDAVGRGKHLRAGSGGDVNSCVERPFAAERVHALAKAGCDLAPDRPEGWDW